MANNIEAHVLVSGKVQGVYYRAHAREEAHRLGIAGWIRNLPDGRVEGLFRGPEEAVRAMVKWCKTGPPRAVVTAVECEERVLDEGWDGPHDFEIR